VDKGEDAKPKRVLKLQVLGKLELQWKFTCTLQSLIAGAPLVIEPGVTALHVPLGL
jgi:hypothetical protein